MAEGDEDKTAFFVEEGVFCYRKMPFGLKNAGAMYQRLVDKVFNKQIERNLEAYVDDMVIKSTSEEGMLSDIQETFERFWSINMKLNPKKCLFGVEEGLFLGDLITKLGIKANHMKIKEVPKLEQPRALKDIQSLNGKLAALSRFLSKGAERSLPFFKVLKSSPRVGETLTMYLAALKESINAALFAKRSEEHIPIYFISRVLQGAELNYPALEKLILALVHAARRLRRYFQAHTIMVPTGAGLMLIDLAGNEYTYALRFEFETTNNKAEYETLLAGLHIAQEMEITKVVIFLDSQLVVNQIKGTYTAKQLSIKSYLQKVKTALKGFKGYIVEHVRRNQNKKPNALNKLISMTFEHLTKEVLVKVLAKRSIKEKEVLKVEIEEKKKLDEPHPRIFVKRSTTRGYEGG
ncbi:reverse transcriptase domain-containing protein [Tanacetum coccineum]